MTTASCRGQKVDDNLMKKISGIRSDGNILPLPVMSVEAFHFPEGDLAFVPLTTATSVPLPPLPTLLVRNV